MPGAGSRRGRAGHLRRGNRAATDSQPKWNDDHLSPVDARTALQTRPVSDTGVTGTTTTRRWRRPPGTAQALNRSLRLRDAHAPTRPARGQRRRAWLQQLRRPHRPGGVARGHRRGARRRRHVLRHRRHLRRRRRQRDDHRQRAPRTPRPGRAGDEVRQGDERRCDPSRVTRVHPRSSGRITAAVADRRDRPLPAPRGGSRDAARGDVCGSRRARGGGQDPRVRDVELRAGNAPPRAGDRRAGLRLRAERVLLARARGRGRAAADLPGARPRLHPVLPARVRAADGQGCAGLTARARHPPVRPADRGGQARAGRAAARAGRKPTARRCSTSRSAGFWP